MKHLPHKIDENDVIDIERLGHSVVGWNPDACWGKTRLTPNMTEFITNGGNKVGVFHVKPVYYLTHHDTWRPLSEVCEWHGNRKIVLKTNWMLYMNPWYFKWLSNRQRLLGEELQVGGIESPFIPALQPHNQTFALTDTSYPDPNPETATFDGLYTNATTTSWDACHDDTTSTPSDSGTILQLDNSLDIGANCTLRRSVALFDTSGIGGSDTKNSATASFYSTATLNGDDDGNDFVSIVQTQGDVLGSDTGGSSGDFNDIGDAVDNPTEGHDTGQRKDITGISTGSYLDWTLNSTGIGWIARSGEAIPTGATNGITYLGLRGGFDVLDVTPTTNTSTRYQCSSADASGTSQDPKLVTDYTAAAGGTVVPLPNMLLMGVG